MSIKKEVLFRIFRIGLVILLTKLLFPFTQTFFVTYFDEITLVFVLSCLLISISTGFLTRLTIVSLKIIKKDTLIVKDTLTKKIYLPLTFVLFTTYALYLKVSLNTFYIVLILIGIELYGIIVSIIKNRKNKKIELK